MDPQLATMSRFAEDDALSEAIAALQDQLADLQMSMVDPRLTGQGHDGVRFEAKLLHEQLREHLEALEALVATEVHALKRNAEGPGGC